MKKWFQKNSTNSVILEYNQLFQSTNFMEIRMFIWQKKIQKYKILTYVKKLKVFPCCLNLIGFEK